MRGPELRKLLPRKILRADTHSDKVPTVGSELAAKREEEKAESESEKKRLIFLSKRVYDIIKSHGVISGTSVILLLQMMSNIAYRYQTYLRPI